MPHGAFSWFGVHGGNQDVRRRIAVHGQGGERVDSGVS